MFKKYFLTSAAFILAFTGNASAFDVRAPQAQTPSLSMSVVNEKALKGAEKFVGSVADRGIGFLSNESLSQDQRKKEFQKLLRNSFDLDRIGRFALGRYWRTTNSKQRAEYIKLFKKMVLDVYASRFKEYTGQTLEVVSARPEGKSDILVSSIIKGPDSPEVKVDWRVRHKGSSYKVIDVLVAGVSMALTQRSDFASVIERGGGDVEVLIAHLKE